MTETTIKSISWVQNKKPCPAHQQFPGGLLSMGEETVIRPNYCGSENKKFFDLKPAWLVNYKCNVVFKFSELTHTNELLV